jgi:hypothetical protein
MPPLFLAAGGDDAVSASYPEVNRTLKHAGVRDELHIYSRVAHGFGMQPAIPLAAAYGLTGCGTGCLTAACCRSSSRRFAGSDSVPLILTGAWSAFDCNVCFAAKPPPMPPRVSGVPWH